jgi:hypothetical protein
LTPSRTTRRRQWRFPRITSPLTALPLLADDDHASKQATTILPEPERDLTADISTIVEQFDVDELEDLLTAEGGRNPQVLDSVLQFFDLSRNNDSILTIESYLHILPTGKPSIYVGL